MHEFENRLICLNNKCQFKETLCSFRSAAQKSLAKLRNYCESLTTESKLLKEKALFEFIQQKGHTLNECVDFLLCFVMLGSVLQCCLHEVEFFISLSIYCNLNKNRYLPTENYIEAIL